MPTKSVRGNPRTSPPTRVACDWKGSALKNESTLHQLSPYIGKLKSSIAGSLISQFSDEGDLVYDPFSGSGTVALEAWSRNRRVIANDLSPYASVLTRGKLFPPPTLHDAFADIHRASTHAGIFRGDVDLRSVPCWVRQFFHPETLRETIGWTKALKRQQSWFLLASLLGILHHQRPGFLSYPSSHTVPYLRIKKFPRYKFPRLYEYRSLRDRLEAKVIRAYRRIPELDYNASRLCFSKNAASLQLPEKADVIISSPPYMRLLDYARDNRLRLWFLGVRDWHRLEEAISPRRPTFLELMRDCFINWKKTLKRGHYCVLVIGDAFRQVADADLPDVVSRIATEDVGGYKRICKHTEIIPNERRVRRGVNGSASETIVVLRTVE